MMRLGGFLASFLPRLLGQSGGGTFWLPPEASTTAPAVDWVFKFILIIACVFFLLIVGLMVLFVVRYRRRQGRQAEQTPTHITSLEVIWTAIPLVLVLLIFFFGFKTYLNMNTPPANAYEILVTAQKWNWSFTYPNGYVDGNLHVPVNTPIQLVMTSEDVIHSFYVPAFRVKRDVVPGRYNKVWFEAHTPGEFTLFCAEYCGAKHSDMLATVFVHEPGGYEKWLQDGAEALDKASPQQAGARLYKARGCASCHTVDGKAGIGPSFKGVFGHEVILVDGTKLKADEDYIRESILEPRAKVVAGFDPVMPTYKGRIKDKDITAIIEYLKTLR